MMTSYVKIVVVCCIVVCNNNLVLVVDEIQNIERITDSTEERANYDKTIFRCVQ